MTASRLDVLCIGNAIVDVIADADDAFLAAQGLDKGSMRLIDEAEAVRLYGEMKPGREISGGSAGNTAAGLASLGLKAGFIGQVASDELGDIYRHDVESLGVDFLVPARGDVGATARSLILVTPDAQRTMNTFLGAAQRLEARDIDPARVADASILYLEGYLWDPAEPRAAMEAAIAASRDAGRKVAFTLSDTFCVDRHRDGFQALIDAGKIDGKKLIDHDALQAAGIARGGKHGVRLLGKGELTAKATFKVSGASKGALAAVEKAGGSVEVIVVKPAAEKAAEKKAAKPAAGE